MSAINFKKEAFIKDNEQYQIEFKIQEIGEGSNLVIEKEKENGEYEVIQAEIKRFNDSIFIAWSEPFNGRIIFEK